MILMTSFRKKPSRPIATVLALLMFAFILSGCDLLKNDLKIDRSGNKEVQDYRDALAPRPIPGDDAKPSKDPNAGIPSLQSYVAQPSDNLKPMPLVSISVNQTVPLRDILFELAKQANYDIELDPRITGSIIFTAHDQPFDLVVQRIADTAGLRYKFDGNVLRVENDTPYHQIYKIDYLSYVRKSSSSVNNNISLAQTAGGGTGGAATGSQFQAASESEANFWGELQTNLTQIMGVSSTAGDMKTDSDPQITAVAPPPTATPIPQGGTPKAGQTPPATAALQVSSLPTTATGGATAAAAPAAAAGGSGGAPNFSINKQGGIISVYATERQQKQIQDYLKQLRRSVTAQVLIEAKVMEVNLSDEFASGVDWTKLVNAFNGRLQIAPGNYAIPALTPAATGGLTFGVGTNNLSSDAIFQAVQRFGTVKALSSPRMTVINNQSAVLNVANNQVYFSLSVQVQQGTNGSGNLTTVNSTAHNVPEGVLINVQPSIDLDNRSISLSLRPTVTRIVGEVEDPAVAFLDISGLTSNVPVVNVQEMDSVIKLDSGQAVVMGGLMQDRTDSSQTGVPVLSEVPMVGALFRSQGDKISKTELVIFLKATIVDNTDNADDADHDLYKTFGDDRHPFKI